MATFVLNETNSVGNHFLAELRDAEVQKDSMRFRKNMERLGEIFAYEISKKLDYVASDFETPLGTTTIPVLKEYPALGAILRAGLPLMQGLLNFFDRADCAFITARREHHLNGDFTIQLDSVLSNCLDNKILILSDPMLATGLSMIQCAKDLLNKYKLKELHVVTTIASREGLSLLKANIPNAHIWVGGIDEELTSKGYIVPGLGDAGDLAFGLKC